MDIEKQLIREFNAAKRLHCNPRDPTFLAVIKDIVGDNKEMKEYANFLWLNYKNEYEKEIKRNG
jgi:hypothetical protein